MDVIYELKFLGKFTQKKIWGVSVGGGGGGGGWAIGVGGQGGCERRIEVFVNNKKKNGGGGGRVGGGGSGE